MKCVYRIRTEITWPGEACPVFKYSFAHIYRVARKLSTPSHSRRTSLMLLHDDMQLSLAHVAINDTSNASSVSVKLGVAQELSYRIIPACDPSRWKGNASFWTIKKSWHRFSTPAVKVVMTAWC